MKKSILLMIPFTLLFFGCGGGSSGPTDSPPTPSEVETFRTTSPDSPTSVMDVGKKYSSSHAYHVSLTNPTVTFKWNAVDNATAYWLAVTNNLSSTGPEMLFWGDVGDVTSYTLTIPRDGRVYYWMVAAGNNTGWGRWSSYQSFSAPQP